MGLSYIAVSRVKALNGVLFKGPFDFERFKDVNSVISEKRELDHIYRNEQLL